MGPNKIKELVKKTITEVVKQNNQPQLSHDVALFLKVRQGMKEAIDTTGYPDFIDPDKRDTIENETDFVENALPELGPQSAKYLDIVASEAYKNAVDKAARYSGTTVEQLHLKFPDVHTALGILISTAKQIEHLERNSIPQLEKLAVDVVLSLPENKYIKKLVETKKIILDVKLAPAELKEAIAEDELNQPMQNGLTVQENLDAQVVSVLMGETESKLKRALANQLTQGDAVNKFFLYNMVNDQLRQIDPTLPEKYGLVSATSLVLNYWMPKNSFSREFTNFCAVGSAQVIPNGNIYILKVRGRNFPLLIHELVKAIGDYLSMDIASKEELETETLPEELKQFLVGPGLDMRLRNSIPDDKIQYLPYIKKLLYRLPLNQIKEIFLGGGKAQAIMKRLIQTAEQQVKSQGGED